tara:strand:- start:179 stop:754 length:576 start_codon:yes stop_codon:yes gene_type:complete
MADIKVRVGGDSIKARVGQKNVVKVIAAASGGAISADTAINVIGGIASVSQLSVGEAPGMAGVSTFFGEAFFKNQLSVDGITTLNGITTITAPTLFTKQLNIAGVSSFIGIVTTGSDLFVGGDLYVGDDLRFDEFNARNGNITGILTAATSNVTNNFTVGGTADITSALTVGANADITGTLTAGLIDGGSY